MNNNQHHIGGDITSLLLMGGNWITLTLSIYPIAIKWLQVAGLGFGLLASMVVFIDHSMKILWKVKENRKNKPHRNRRKEGDE